jgi:hypothetical protein
VHVSFEDIYADYRALKLKFKSNEHLGFDFALQHGTAEQHFGKINNGFDFL